MTSGQLISGVIIEKSQSLTLEEFCQATHTQKELVVEMVEYQLIKPEGKTPQEWRFDSISLKRGRIASSFYRELEVNMPGVVLALRLLDMLDELELEVGILKKPPPSNP